jgi:acyl CoA:acetate/3-ketoacid CoA transferase
MTANFNVAFAMSGIVFYVMLVGTWNGITRSAFCFTFAIVIAVFMCAAHLFYYHNIEVTVADVDAEGNVDPNRLKDKGGFSDFKWDEVWEIISSHELLMLAFF